MRGIPDYRHNTAVGSIPDCFMCAHRQGHSEAGIRETVNAADYTPKSPECQPFSPVQHELEKCRSPGYN